MKYAPVLNFPKEIIETLDQHVILDVRTCHEFVGGHIKGAMNIPYEQLDFFLEEILGWNKAIVVCSAGGYRSRLAANFLNARGLKAIDGGDWETLHRAMQNEKH